MKDEDVVTEEEFKALLADVSEIEVLKGSPGNLPEPQTGPRVTKGK